MSNIHAQAINLARRYSERNENDLLQESFCDDPTTTTTSFSEDYCYGFLSSSSSSQRLNNNIPKECEKFANVRAALRERRKTDQDDEAVAFAGMDAGSALEARRARAHGHLNGAQIRRRMTSHDHETKKSNNGSTSWFF